MEVKDSILDLVGNTPILKVGNNVFYKLEYYNPIRTIADRFNKKLLQDVNRNVVIKIENINILTISFILLSRAKRIKILIDDSVYVDSSEFTELLSLLNITNQKSKNNLSYKNIFNFKKADIVNNVLNDLRIEVEEEIGVNDYKIIFPILPWIDNMKKIVNNSFFKQFLFIDLIKYNNKINFNGLKKTAKEASLQFGITPSTCGANVIEYIHKYKKPNIKYIGLITDSSEWNSYTYKEFSK